MAIRIGLGELDNAERYPAEIKALGVAQEDWDRDKHCRTTIRTALSRGQGERRRFKCEVILWRFAPEFDDHILEAIQRARRMGDVECVQQLTAFFESRQSRREAYLATREANWWRTVYIDPDKYNPQLVQLVTFLLTVILRQEGVIPYTEEESLDTHAVQYLESLRWAEDGQAYFSILRNMAGNETWKGLRRYIKSAARGLALNALKEDFSPERISRYIDEEHTVYNPYWVAREIGRVKRTVDRWMDKHGYTTVQTSRGCAHGLSEDQWAAIQAEYAPKQDRKDLWKKGRELKLSDDVIKQTISRGFKAKKTSQAIQAALERSAARQRRRKGKEDGTGSREASMSHHGSEDALAEPSAAVLKDNIAELEALKGMATTPEELCTVMEALEDAYERLRQLQPGAPP